MTEIFDVQDPSFKIPLIDFSKYHSATSPFEKRETADAIVNGFKTVGFIYLEKHGIPDSKVKSTFAKVGTKWTSSEVKRGLKDFSEQGVLRSPRRRESESTPSNPLSINSQRG